MRDMNNLKKSDRKIECVADMMRALLDGEVLVYRNDGSVLEICEGKLTFKSSLVSAFKLSHDVWLSEKLASIWEAYKRVEWHENIPKHGVICYVGGTMNKQLRRIACICSYDEGRGRCPFIDTSDTGWENAIPLTKDELLNYCLEEQARKDD